MKLQKLKAQFIYPLSLPDELTKLSCLIRFWHVKLEAVEV